MDITGQAAWVAQLAHIEYFKHMLAAFQVAAVERGFRFAEGTEPCVLTEEEIKHFGQVIVRARNKFISPLAVDAVAERWAETAAEDGYDAQWVRSITAALAKREIVMERVHQTVTEPLPDFWVAMSERLRADLSEKGIDYTAADDVIMSSAGHWFADLSYNTRSALISTLRGAVAHGTST